MGRRGVSVFIVILSASEGSRSCVAISAPQDDITQKAFKTRDQGHYGDNNLIRL
jgi:hypothetical protein